jgi:hypothetical protein
MSTFRKTAREAVIFMLLGPVVAVLVCFMFLQKRSIANIKAEATQSVFAIDAAQEPVGFTPVNSVLVPLTNGMQLNVTDCAQAHPIDWFDQNAPNKSVNVTKAQTDRAELILRSAQVNDKTRTAARDAFRQSKNEDELARGYRK